MYQRFGNDLRDAIATVGTLPFIGVYDVFSATIAAQHFDGVFISGFGFSASYYGLPDIGFNAWSDIVAFVSRVRTVLPQHHILVDIDDGFADTEVACHVVTLLESAGASGIILEDQARPRRCGHLAGKRSVPLNEFMEKLGRVLHTRQDLFVVARTDATERQEILRRVSAFDSTDADAILVDGLGDLSLLNDVRPLTGKPLVLNQIVGGKTSPLSLDELREAGISMGLFSIPCLAAAQQAITSVMARLQNRGVDSGVGGVTLQECNQLLESNLVRRDAGKTPFTAGTTYDVTTCGHGRH